MAIGTPASIGTRTATGNPVNLTTTGAITTGDLVVVWCACNAVGGITSLTDTSGNTYTATTTFSIGSARLRMFYCKNATAMSSGNTIAITQGSGANTIYATATVVSGIDTTSPLDISGAGTTASGTTPSIATGTLGQADEFITACVYVGSGSGDAYTESSSFTTRASVGASNIIHVADEVVAATTTQTFAPTLGTSRTYGANVFTFKAAATGGGTYSPGKATLSLTGKTPTAVSDRTFTPGKGALALTGKTPAVVSNSNFAPGKASLAFTGKTPAATSASIIAPGKASLTLTGRTPAMKSDTTFGPGKASLLIVGYPPGSAGSTTYIPGKATLTLTGQKPALIQNMTVAPGRAILTLTGKTPALGVSTICAPGPARLTVSAYAPVLGVTWYGQSDTPETWTPASVTAETWTPAPPTPETWSVTSPTAESWSSVTVTSETWTSTTGSPTPSPPPPPPPVGTTRREEDTTARTQEDTTTRILET